MVPSWPLESTKTAAPRSQVVTPEMPAMKVLLLLPFPMRMVLDSPCTPLTLLPMSMLLLPVTKSPAPPPMAVLLLPGLCSSG